MMVSRSEKRGNCLVLLTAIAPGVGLFLSFAKADLQILVALGVGLLALLIAVNSLLFNRARAWPAGATQRRSLIAGEILLRALFWTVLTIIISLGITYFMPKSAYLSQEVARSDYFFPYVRELNPRLWFYVVPCLTFFSAYINVWQAFRVALHRRRYVVGPRGLRDLFRRLKV
jgi:hypothetical protein